MIYFVLAMYALDASYHTEGWVAAVHYVNSVLSAVMALLSLWFWYTGEAK